MSRKGFTPLEIRSLNRGNGNATIGITKKRRFLSLTGFTLIEIMVVLAVVVVLFGISVPHFARFTSGVRLKAGAREISTTLQTAMSYACSRRKPHSVKFDLEREEFWISYKDPESGEVVLGKVFRVPQGIDITQTSFADDKVEFKPSGRASEGGSIWIADKRGMIRRISVSQLTGTVKIDHRPPQ